RRGAVPVANGDRGDEIAVEDGRSGERQPIAADDAAFTGLRQCRRQGGDLLRLLAPVPSSSACQCVEQDVCAVIADVSRKIIVLQRRRKTGQHPSDASRHVILPDEVILGLSRQCYRQSWDNDTPDVSVQCNARLLSRHPGGLQDAKPVLECPASNRERRWNSPRCFSPSRSSCWPHGSAPAPWRWRCSRSRSWPAWRPICIMPPTR